MGERKVVNKYIPPDFDPALVPRGKKLSAKDGTVPVRMMLPFTAQCGTCHTFLYRGTKFNSKKEAMGGPDGTYLGITRWRFYIKCTSCARPITFLTDPKNADYEMESGGTRNYEVYKDKAESEEAAVHEKQEEETLDPMKALENRVLDSKREMQEMANLEAIRAMNTRHVHLLLNGDGRNVLADNDDGADNSDEMAAHHGLLTEEDEALIQSIQFRSSKAAAASHAGSIYTNASDNEVRRLNEDDEERLERERKRTLRQLEQQQNDLLNRAGQSNHASKKSVGLPVIVKKRRRVVPSNTSTAAELGGGEAGAQAAKDVVAAASNAIGADSHNGKDETKSAAATTEPRNRTNSINDSSGTGTTAAAAAAAAAAASTSALSSLLGGYGSDSDSDS